MTGNLGIVVDLHVAVTGIEMLTRSRIALYSSYIIRIEWKV